MRYVPALSTWRNFYFPMYALCTVSNTPKNSEHGSAPPPFFWQCQDFQGAYFAHPSLRGKYILRKARRAPPICSLRAKQGLGDQLRGTSCYSSHRACQFSTRYALANHHTTPNMAKFPVEKGLELKIGRPKYIMALEVLEQSGLRLLAGGN